jgi:hypothetical protein
MASYFSFDSSTPREDDSIGCLPQLSMKERTYAFFICFGLGILIELVSLFSIASLVIHPSHFAVTYTLGNILLLLATGFLVGFTRQLKSVFDKKRWIASTVFLSSMLMTLISALVLRKSLLSLIFIIVQGCALAWYVASYIPWGQTCLKSIVNRLCLSST